MPDDNELDLVEQQTADGPEVKPGIDPNIAQTADPHPGA